MTRELWKIYYRQLRIARREAGKAYIDAILYGRGFVRVGEDVPDLIQHVPATEVLA